MRERREEKVNVKARRVERERVEASAPKANKHPIYHAAAPPSPGNQSRTGGRSRSRRARARRKKASSQRVAVDPATSRCVSLSPAPAAAATDCTVTVLCRTGLQRMLRVLQHPISPSSHHPRRSFLPRRD